MPYAWTKEQIEYFENSWGIVSLATISKKIGKEPTTVEAWRKRKGYSSNTLSSEYISVHEFAKAVGIDAKTIYKYWIPKGLPIKKFKPGIKRTKKMIDIQAFWKWAIKNIHFINFNKIKPYALGSEPEWVDKYRKRDFEDKGKSGWEKPWSEEENLKLISLLKTMKYTYKDLSEVLGRTELSIQNHFYETKIKLRPIPAERRKWTKEEEEILIEMSALGESSANIAKKLDCGQIQVKTKISRLKKAKAREEK